MCICAWHKNLFYFRQIMLDDLTDKYFALTLVGSSKLGNGGAPNDGTIETIVRTITVTGIRMATHSAIASCFVNLDM